MLPGSPESSEDIDMFSKQIREMYDNDPILKKFDHIGPRKSIVDFYSSEHEYDESDFEIRGNILSRRNSSSVFGQRHSSNSQQQVGNLETLDNLANAASQHSTLYSYHYMDETDKTVLSHFRFVYCLFHMTHN